MKNPQPAFDRAQEIVAGFEGFIILGAQETVTVQCLQRLPRIRRAQVRKLARIFQLEQLHEKLDIDETAEAAFQVPPAAGIPAAAALLDHESAYLARLLRLETKPLSDQEIAESMRQHIMYTPRDLFLVEWSAAFLLDQDCDETLQIIEFANVQLLEFRHIANRLDDRLDAAYALIHPLARSRLPFWRGHQRPLRALGELKVEANGLFERTGNVLKLVGDQYLVRAYRLLVARFHLDAWEHDIERSLNVVQDVYQVVSDQAAAFRIEVLEIIVIVLIMIEVGLSLARH